MTKITLYHANWCGHCKRFKPNWDSLKTFFDSNNIQHNEYEHSQNQKEIDQANIEGFPTIKINKNGKEYEYKGERTEEALKKELVNNVQSGGADLDEKMYKHKYLKYKKKYLSLKGGSDDDDMADFQQTQAPKNENEIERDIIDKIKAILNSSPTEANKKKLFEDLLTIKNKIIEESIQNKSELKDELTKIYNTNQNSSVEDMLEEINNFLKKQLI